MTKIEKLKKLQIELDETYNEMKEILTRNNLTTRYVLRLPPEEFNKYQSLSIKSTLLINEFSDLLKSQP